MPQLTSTRFFAAISIVIFHSAIFGGNVFPFQYSFVYPVFRYAYIGVNYFFVLSGFILTYSYYSRKNFSLINFWMARLVRIYPLYFIAFLAMLLVPYLPYGDACQSFKKQIFDNHLDFSQPVQLLRLFYHSFVAYLSTLDLKTVLSSLTLSQAWFFDYTMTINPPGWSLSVEAFFYLTFPLWLYFFWQLPHRFMVLSVVLVWTVTVICQLNFIAEINGGESVLSFKGYLVRFQHPLNHLSSFLFGIMTCVLLLKKNKYIFWGLSVLAAISFVLLLLLSNASHILAGGIFSPIFSLSIAWLAQLPNGKLLTALSWKPLVYLGEVSYGIYILQMPVYELSQQLYKLIGFAPNDTARFYFHVIVLLLVSVFLYQFVEKKVRDVYRRWVG